MKRIPCTKKGICPLCKIREELIGILIAYEAVGYICWECLGKILNDRKTIYRKEILCEDEGTAGDTGDGVE